MRSQTTRTIAGRVATDGTINLTNGGFSSRRTATGTYELVFADMQVTSCVVNSISAVGIIAQASGFPSGARTVTVNVMNAGSSAAQDGPFSFVASGVR